MRKQLAVLFLTVVVLFCFPLNSIFASEDDTTAPASDTIDYEALLDKLLKVYTRDPANVRVIVLLGITYSNLGEYDKALQIFDEGLAQNPRDPGILFNLALTWYRKGDLQRARAEWHTLLNTVPVSDYTERTREYIYEIDRSLIMEYYPQIPDHLDNDRYSEAIPFLENMHESDPYNILTLLYLGRCYYQTQDYARSLESYSSALVLDPHSTQVLYNVGIAHYAAGNREEAREQFTQVIETDPTSPYGTKALRALSAFDGGIRRVKPWNLSVRTGLQYDDNVVLEPNNGISGLQSDAWRWVVYTTGEYRVYDTDAWTVGFTGSFYQNAHFDGEVEDYNLTSFRPGAYIAHHLNLFDIPVTVQADYGFKFDLLEADSYSCIHTVGASVTAQPFPNALTKVDYACDLEEFFDDGSAPNVTSLDGVTNTVGITQYLFFSENTRYCYLRVDWQNKDAQGANFNYNRVRLVGGYACPFFLDTRLHLWTEYYYRDFSPFVNIGGPDRAEHYHNYNVGLSKQLNDSTKVEVSYSFIRNDANITTLEYNRNIVDFSVVWDF